MKDGREPGNQAGGADARSPRAVNFMLRYLVEVPHPGLGRLRRMRRMAAGASATGGAAPSRTWRQEAPEAPQPGLHPRDAVHAVLHDRLPGSPTKSEMT